MSEQTAPEPKLYTTAANARQLVHSILKGNGVPDEHAAIIARCLIAADLRGIDTHGMNRIPSYMTRIRNGALDPRAAPTYSETTPVAGQVDGHNAFGFLSAHMGIHKAIDMARTYGIGMVSVKHSNHFGMSAWIVQEALDAGMMSLVFTNSSPAMPAWGGKDKLLGVSPIAAGAPAGEGTPPFILDMAPSVAARGKIYKALRRGESIPVDWALDKDGQRTEDPQAALGGTMLPMGGPKGSGLAVLMDVFSGAFSGSAFAGAVKGPYDPSGEADVGHWFLVMKPGLFVGEDEFKRRMDHLYQTVTGSAKMEGVERVYFPGELEIEQQRRREKDGIPLVKAEVDALNAEAQKVGVRTLVLTESQ